MTFDYINAAFECVGAFLSWMNVRRLISDKKVAGVHWQVVGFFAAWGYWNLFYYPSLGQWWSTAAGGLLALANTVWVVLALRYQT